MGRPSSRGARRLAKELHPDTGGDPDAMRRVNVAADGLLALLAAPAAASTAPQSGPPPPAPSASSTPPPSSPATPGPTSSSGQRIDHDVASFTIEALPVEAFEALLVVTSWIGEVIVDEPPYQLDVLLTDRLRCWCRLDLVPDAGATTVAVTIGTLPDEPLPDIDAVRDLWVGCLNHLGQPTRTPRMPDELVTTDIGRAVACLRAGGLVALPTETVYGLAADASRPDAVARIYEAKGRPHGHPLIVHLDAAEAVGAWVLDISPAGETLAATCWPGPLTLLLHRSAWVPDVVTGGRPTVGISVPAHLMATEVLAAFGGGLAAPSANRFGRVSPTTAGHVLSDLGPWLDPARDVILDGGPSPVGVESTIVDCTVAPPQVLRPGRHPHRGDRRVDRPRRRCDGPSRAAGMLASHYAPVAVVHLVDARPAADDLAVELIAAGRHPVIVDGTGDLVGFARTLYADLRRADDVGATDVIAVRPPAVGLGHAIRDRLTKAAGPT